MSVQVTSGANDGNFPLEGNTVAQLRQKLGAALNIAADASATINGIRATDTSIAYDGDEVVFARATAEKGV